MSRKKNLVWKLALKLLDAKVGVSSRYRLSLQQQDEIRKVVEVGDVLLDSNSAFPCSQLMARVFFNTSWIHSGIYAGDGIVIDSGRKSHVAKVNLNDFLKTTDLAVYRPEYQDASDCAAAVEFATKALGKPFNITFDEKNGKAFYCTQLVAEALASMPHPIHLEQRSFFWKKVFPPASVATCPQIKCVWSSHPSPLKAARCHTPIFAGAVTGGVTALVLTGSNMWLGALAGSFLTSRLIREAKQ
jgi:Permuted papain-like amidase enzyme, YaeF/YiiX, C92 family